MANFTLMFGFAVWIALVISFTLADSNIIPFENHVLPFKQQINRELAKDIERYGFKDIEYRRKMLQSIAISDCIFVTSESGIFTYKATSDNASVCGVYFMADADKTIELMFLSFNVPCKDDGLVSFVDGWELNGEFFPSPMDHHLPQRKRYTEFCGKHKKRVFQSSQNAALIQYRIPFKGYGFKIIVRHRKNPTPCNILVDTTSESFTLRNYGVQINCTLMAVYSSVLRVIDLNVGRKSLRSSSRQMKPGIVHNCDKHGLHDQVQIGGSKGLDTSKGEIYDSICGVDSESGGKSKIIGCGVTSVRLVSSGLFDNSVTVTFKQAMEDDILDSNFICKI